MWGWLAGDQAVDNGGEGCDPDGDNDEDVDCRVEGLVADAFFLGVEVFTDDTRCSFVPAEPVAEVGGDDGSDGYDGAEPVDEGGVEFVGQVGEDGEVGGAGFSEAVRTEVILTP